jgi:hypothetical protein
MPVGIEDIAPLVQLGFAAVMAMLIWRGYERITGTLLKALQDNTEAVTSLKSVISENTRSTERIGTKLEQLDGRVGNLEHEVERGNRR